jgi:Outer membrane protein beta-barrel domain
MASIAATGIWAQEAEPDVGEASVSTGLAFGGTQTNVLVGGAIGISLDRYLVLMVGASFIPMGNSTLVSYPGVVAHGSGLYDFDIPLQIRIPLRRKWEPYGIVAPVLIYNHYRRESFRPDGAATYFGASDVRGGAEIGGGVRYYLHEYWGLKSEYRYTITSRNFSLLSVGVFRQF